MIKKMQLTKYETVMLYIIAVLEKLKAIFLKVYPTAAVIFSIIYAYGLIGGLDRNRVTTADFYNAVYIAVGLTILTLIYLVLSLREKIRGGVKCRITKK